MTDVGEGATVVARDSVPVERTWDAESVFSSVEAWEAELDAVLADLPSVTQFEGRLGEGPIVLREALEARDALVGRANRVVVYAYLGYAVETTNTDAVGRLGRAQSLRGAVAAGTSFFAPEMLTIRTDTLLAWLAEDEGLAVYAHHVDDLHRQEPHVRSGEVEEALGLVSDPFASVYATYSALVDSDLRFAPAVGSDGTTRPVSQGTVFALVADPDRGCSPKRVGELRGRAPLGSQHPRFEPAGSRQAGRLPGTHTPARVDAACLSRALERPDRRVRERDRDLPGQRRHVAPLLACQAGTARSRQVRAV